MKAFLSYPVTTRTAYYAVRSLHKPKSYYSTPFAGYFARHITCSCCKYTTKANNKVLETNVLPVYLITDIQAFYYATLMPSLQYYLDIQTVCVEFKQNLEYYSS
ncbi:unnamed protein product [Orchesella dallaii]|uniref:Uncharacterized protein n=1 Tax=Orchesella dallaii TaxID=48710 RepID=A0ABP1RHY1_9HEXA